MNTKIIRKVASILMLLVIMSSTLADPITNIGKIIAETYDNTAEETETVVDETPISDVDDGVIVDSENAPIDAEIDSDIEDPNVLESSDTDPPAEVVPTPTKEATDAPTEEPTPIPTEAPTKTTTGVTASSVEAPSTQAICAQKNEPTFEDAFQITENGELVNKVGLKYKNGPSDFFPTNTITSVRLVKTSINDGDSMAVVNAGTLVGPITNPSGSIVDPSKESAQPNGTYTATWNLTPLDIFRIQQEVSGNHTNVKLYYTFTGPGGCETTAITNNTQTSLLDNFKVDIPDPEVTIEPCTTNCTSVEITVNYEDFKTALDITDVQYTSYADYYDNARIEIILQDPLTGGPIALDLDGTVGTPNTTSVDLSGDGTLTEQVFCIDLTPYYTNNGTIDPKLYAEHTYTTNILEPKVPATNPPSTMVVADVDTKFDLPDPLFIDSSAFVATATDDNKIDVTFKVAANTYAATDLAGSIVIKNAANETVDTIALTGTEIKNSATTAITKTSSTPSTPYVDGATYTAILDVYAKDSSGVKIDCSDATASRSVRMQTTPSLVAAECTTNCTSVTLTPAFDTTFYAGKVMRIYVDDGATLLEVDLDPNSVEKYLAVNSFTSGTPLDIDLTSIFPNVGGEINPKVYAPHTYTLKIFANPASTTALKTVTSNSFTVKQPPIISSLTTVAEYDNHITVDYVVDDKSYDNLIGDIKIYSANGLTLLETINLSASDIDGGVAKTSAFTYSPGVEYKIVLNVYEKNLAGNIIECSHKTTDTTVRMKTAPSVVPYQSCDDGCNVTFNFTYDGSMYPVGSDINILATNTKGTVDPSDDVVLPVQKAGDTVAANGTTVALKFLLPDNDLLYTTYHYDISIDASSGYDPTVGTDFALKQAPTTTPLGISYTPSTGTMAITYNYSKNGFSGATASVKIFKDGTAIETVNLANTSGTITRTGLAPGSYTAELTILYSSSTPTGAVPCNPVTSAAGPAVISYPNPTVTPYQSCNDGCDVTFALSYDGTKYVPGTKIYLSIYDKNNVFMEKVEIGATKAVASTDTLTYTLVNDSKLYENHFYTFTIDVPGTPDPSVDTSFALKEAPTTTPLGMNYTPSTGTMAITYNYSKNGFSGATASIEIRKDGVFFETIDVTNTTSGTINRTGLAPGSYTAELTILYSSSTPTGVTPCRPVTSAAGPVVIGYPNPTVTPYQSCNDGCDVTFALSYDGSKYVPGTKIYLSIYDKNNVFMEKVEIGATKAVASTDTLTYTLDNDSKLYENHFYTFTIDVPGMPDPSVDTSYALKEVPTTTPLGMNYTPSTGTMAITYNYSKNGFSNATASIEIRKDGLFFETIDVTNTTSGTINRTGLAPGSYTAELTILYSSGMPADMTPCTPVTSAVGPVVISYPNPTVTPYQSCNDGCDVTFALSYDGTKYVPGTKIYLSVYDKNNVFMEKVEIGATKAVASTDTLTYTLVNDSKLYENHFYTFTIDVPGTPDPSVDTSFALKEAPTTTPLGMNYTPSTGTMAITYNYSKNGFNGATASIEIRKDGVFFETIDVTNTTSGTINRTGLAPGSYTAELTILYSSSTPTGVTPCRPVTSATGPVVISYPNPTVVPYQSCDDGCDVTFAFSYDGTKYVPGTKIYLSIYDKNNNFIEKVEIGATKAVASTDTLTYTLDNDGKLYENHFYTFTIDVPGTPDPSVTTSYALKQVPTTTPLGMNYTPSTGAMAITYDYSKNGFSEATASIEIKKDGAHYETINLTNTSGTITRTGLEPGIYTAKLTILYSSSTPTEDTPCIPVTSMAAPVVISYPNPTATPYQACDDGCDVTFDLSYDGTKYPTGSKIYLSVYDKNNDELIKDIEIGTTIDAATIAKLTYTLPNETDLDKSILYDNHYYTFRIDIPGVTADPTVDTNFELKEAPTPVKFDMNYAAGEMTFDFDIDVKDFIGAKAHIELYKDGVLIPAAVPLSNIVSDGHIAELINIDQLEPGVYSAKLVVDYAIGDDDCNPIERESRAITVTYPNPLVNPYQICDDKCNVTFDLTYDGTMYPNGSPIHFITYDDEGEVATDKIVGYTSSTKGVIDTFKNDLAKDILVKDTLYDSHKYTFKIDISGVTADPFVDTNYTLLQKPSITTFDTSYAAGEMTINYDYSANDFDNASAYISISKDGEHFEDINFEDYKGTIVLDHMLPGVYTAELIINYSIGEDDCIAVTQANEPITVAYPNPDITPSQDCSKDGVVDVTLGYNANNYPENSEVVVLKDGKEVLRYLISDASHKVIDEDLYKYEIEVTDYDEHTYSVYIDTKVGTEFNPYSEDIKFTLLERPEITSVNMVANKDMTLTINYATNLHDYENATGTLLITGPNEFTETIEINSMDLLSGSITTDKLMAGTYNATLMINYGESCIPVNLKTTPVTLKEEPKLVYTGLENNLFEAIIIEIKEIFVNAA